MNASEIDPAQEETVPLPNPSAPPVWRRVLSLAWPALLQNWLVLTVGVSDRLLASRFQDLDAVDQAATLAAQTTAVYLGWFLSSYTYLVSIGGTVLVARMTGAGDSRGARVVLHQTLLLAFVLGLAGMLAGLVLLRPGLAFLNLQEPAAGFAARYLLPLLMQLPLQIIGAAGIACLAGAGDTRTGLAVLGSVAICNVPLAWLFFHGMGPIPGFGFVGIAVGTAIAQSMGSLAVLLVLFRGRAGLRLRLGSLRLNPPMLARILRVSVPAALDSMSMQIGYLWFLAIINRLGDVAAAAHGVALAWEALGYQSGAAFGTATITVVGQSLGSQDPERAARGARVAFAWGVGIMSLMGACFWLLAVPMFELFNPHPSQRAIVETGVPVLRLVAFGMPALASCLILVKALQGAGDTRSPMLITWVGFFLVRIPLAYWLTGSYGLYGAWLAMFADLQLRGLFVLLRFASGHWKKERV